MQNSAMCRSGKDDGMRFAWYEWLGVSGNLFFSMATWLVVLGVPPSDAIMSMLGFSAVSGLILYLRYCLSKEMEE